MQLHSQPHSMSGTPRWAPGGERLAFDSNMDGTLRIYLTRAGGGKPVPLTVGPAAAIPSWSADGNWVYFTRLGSHPQIWKAPAGGGEALQVTRHGGFVAFESRDGKSLYYTKHDETDVGPLWKMPASGGEEALVFPSVFGRNFAVVNGGLYFIELDAKQASIRFLAFATGKVRTIAPIPSYEYGEGMCVSPDERSILLSRLDTMSSGLMLVENFLP